MCGIDVQQFIHDVLGHSSDARSRFVMKTADMTLTFRSSDTAARVRCAEEALMKRARQALSSAGPARCEAAILSCCFMACLALELHYCILNMEESMSGGVLDFFTVLQHAFALQWHAHLASTTNTRINYQTIVRASFWQIFMVAAGQGRFV